MADYCARELDDMVRRLLPVEILADIGIMADAAPSPSQSPCSDHGAVVVEELAAHLVGILGLDCKRGRRDPPPPPAAAACRQPEVLLQQGRRRGGTSTDGGGDGYAGMGGCHAPAGTWNGTVARRLPKFEPAAPFYAAEHRAPPPPPAATPRHGGGTGVFLPRAEVYLSRAASTTSPSPISNGEHRRRAVPPRQLRKDQTAAAMKRQQLQLQLRAIMAAEMEARRREEAFAAAAFHGCPALALQPPQEQRTTYCCW